MTAAGPEFVAEQEQNEKSSHPSSQNKLDKSPANAANSKQKHSAMSRDDKAKHQVDDSPKLPSPQEHAAALRLQAVARGRNGRGQAESRRVAATRNEQLRKQALMRECRSRGLQSAVQHAAVRQNEAAAHLKAFALGRTVRGGVALRVDAAAKENVPTESESLFASLPVRGTSPTASHSICSKAQATDQLPARRRAPAADPTSRTDLSKTVAAAEGISKSGKITAASFGKSKMQPNTARRNKQVTPKNKQRAVKATPNGRESYDSCSAHLKEQLSGVRGPLTGKLLNKSIPTVRSNRERSPMSTDAARNPSVGARAECSLPVIHQTRMNAGASGSGARGTRPAVSKTQTKSKCSLPSLANRGVAA